MQKNHGLGKGMVRLAWVDIPAKVRRGDITPVGAVGVEGLTVGRFHGDRGTSHKSHLRRFRFSGVAGEKGREHLAPWVLLLKPGFLLHKSEIIFGGLGSCRMHGWNMFQKSLQKWVVKF